MCVEIIGLLEECDNFCQNSDFFSFLLTIMLTPCKLLKIYHPQNEPKGTHPLFKRLPDCPYVHSMVKIHKRTKHASLSRDPKSISCICSNDKSCLYFCLCTFLHKSAGWPQAEKECTHRYEKNTIAMRGLKRIPRKALWPSKGCNEPFHSQGHPISTPSDQQKACFFSRFVAAHLSRPY